MSGAWVGVAFMLTCINLMMYVGLGSTNTFLFENDLLSEYFETNFENNETNLLDPASAYNLSLEGGSATISPEPNPLTSVPGVSIISNFLDALEVVWDALKTLFNIMFAPLALFKIEGIPYFITILIAVPMSMLYMMSIWQFIRGSS